MGPNSVNTPAAQWSPTVPLNGVPLWDSMESHSPTVASWGTYDRITDNVGTIFDQEGDTFDFIIIGGGSAGGVVARRLAELEHYRVLLLEAGGGINPLQNIPAMALLMLNYPTIDWKHKTVPQTHSCFALPNNESHWSQGRGLGGTSNLNFLIQSRGCPKDFDNWAKITGDPRWSYEGVLPFFKRSENYQGNRWNSEKVHGRSGTLQIALPEYTGMADVYKKAARELGYNSADLNGYYKEGFDSIYYPIVRGARHGVFAGFLSEPKSRLTVRKFAYVKKVLINDEKLAYGIEYDHHGAKKKAYANREIIISAGAMNSPKILMLSGVGPREELVQHGIEVFSDRPTGKNLQDHISAYLGPFFVNQSITFSIERDVNAFTVAQFLSTGKGVLTTSGTQAMGFFASQKAKEAGEGDWPDIQLILAGVSMTPRFANELSRGFGLRKDLMEIYLKHAEGRESFLQIVSLGRPHAKGEVTLYSDNPYDSPRIDPKYLTNQHDIDVLVEAIKKAVEIVENTKTFKEMDGHFTNEVFPGCENVPFKSDEYWECYARHVSLTLHHIVGSCSMGKSDSPDAVVDPELRVIGIHGLRVIDASVMPAVVVGNTNSPTIMVGEMGANFIINDHPIIVEPIEVITEKNQNVDVNGTIVTSEPPTTNPTTTEIPTTTEDDEEEEYDYEDYEGSRRFQKVNNISTITRIK